MAEWNDGSSTDSGRSLGQNASSSGHDDPAAIRAEISETRERLSDTLSEIGERLNPHVVKEQITERVKEGVREATIGRVENMARSAANSVNATRSSITDTIRDNPMPAAMVAIGLGWLLFNGRRNSGSRMVEYDAHTDYGTSSYDETTGTYARGGNFAGSYPYDGGYEGESAGGREGRGMMRNVRSRAGRLAERTRDAASNVKETVSTRTQDLAEGVSHKAHDLADSVSTRARNVADSARMRTQQGRRRVEDAFQENPLAVGAVTVALGVVAGLAAPRTDREVRLFGDARERVVDRARDVVDGAKEKVQGAAGRVVDEAKRAVREEVPNLKAALKGTSSTSGDAASML